MMKFTGLLCGLAMLATGSSAALADSFGPRFGQSSPYALQNTFDRAQRDSMGFGADDLNDLAPAAGRPMPPDGLENKAIEPQSSETPALGIEQSGQQPENGQAH